MTQNYALPDEDAPDPELPVVRTLSEKVGQELGPEFKIAWVTRVLPQYIGLSGEAFLLDRSLALEYKCAMGDKYSAESFLALTDGRTAFPIKDEPISFMPVSEVEEAIRKAALEKLSRIERRVLGLKDE